MIIDLFFVTQTKQELMLQGLPMSAVTDGVSTPGGASHAPSSDAIRKAINEIQVSIFSIPVLFYIC